MAPDLLRPWSLHCVAKWGILGTEGSPFLPLSRKPSNHLCAGQKLREAKVLGRRANAAERSSYRRGHTLPPKVTSSPHTLSLDSGSHGAGWGLRP